MRGVGLGLSTLSLALPQRGKGPELGAAGRAMEQLVTEGKSWPDRFFVEFSTEEACPLDFSDDPAVVLFFISWAYSAEMGGSHELAQAATYLKRTLKVDLRPVYRYADRNVETPQDRMELEQAWQPAGNLAGCARAIAEHWEHPDATLAPIVLGYEHLAPRLRELAAMCDWGAEREAKVRMTFDLENTERRTARPPGY